MVRYVCHVKLVRKYVEALNFVVSLKTVQFFWTQGTVCYKSLIVQNTKKCDKAVDVVSSSTVHLTLCHQLFKKERKRRKKNQFQSVISVLRFISLLFLEINSRVN